MKPDLVLRIVDSLHREKNIDQDVVFAAIESALVSAAKRKFGEEADLTFLIDRDAGTITGIHDGEPMNEGEPLDFDELFGRIAAQTAKQVIMQKVREAERDALLFEFREQIGELVSGVIQRAEGGAATVALSNVEAILPRSEQIPGETHHANERVRAVVYEVRPQGSRVKVVLSRKHKNLVQRLFETEIPEIADGVIHIEAVAREPGHRSKVAVSSTDSRVDCVGACVGVRGNRIKNIIDELSNERIDIVEYNEDAEEFIKNSLKPAEVQQVLLCRMMGRAIVLVREDQLSLAIGRKGQNVRLASHLCGWDIEIMTEDELQEQIERATSGFSSLDGVTVELAEKLVGEGYLSYDDLSVIEPTDLVAMGEMTIEEAEAVAERAEELALEAEEKAKVEKAKRREEQRHAEAEAKRTAELEAAQAEEPGGEESAEAETTDAEAEASTGETTAEDAEEKTEETETVAEESEAPAEEPTAETTKEAPPAEAIEASEGAAADESKDSAS